MKQLFTEYPEKDELKLYDLTVEQVKVAMDMRYGDKTRAYRDTHAKSHACIRGNLEIFDFDEDKIKEELARRGLTGEQLDGMNLKQGLFARAEQYLTLARFANGRGEPHAKDCGLDTRSMAVKIFGVEGEKLPGSYGDGTQDLVLQNARIFLVKSIADYYEFFKGVNESNGGLPVAWLLTHPQQGFATISITLRTPASLLTESYWTGAPSALGLPGNFAPSQPGREPVTYPAAVKFAFFPVNPEPPHTKIPFQERPGTPKIPFLGIESLAGREKAYGVGKDDPDNHYRDDLQRRLKDPNARYCWDLSIQIQTTPKMSIDDYTVEWSEQEAPFFTVGRLTVESQQVDMSNPDLFNFCENLQFSPWNSLNVHRPIGSLNRLRYMVYPCVAKYRHEKLGLTYQEPTPDKLLAMLPQ